MKTASPSEAELEAVLEDLERLEPMQFEWALSRLHVDGLVERLFGQLSNPRQVAFLELCRENGVLQAAGGRPVEGSCEPPAVPDQYRLEVNQLPELRELAHAHNFMIMVAYHASYRSYLKRYEAALMEADRLPTDARIGPPLMPDALIEPCDAPLYDGAWGRELEEYGKTQSWCLGGELASYEAVNARYQALVGKGPKSN